MGRRTIDIPTIKPRPLINIGATMDIPTCSIVKGKYGESVINGGLPGIVGFIGKGNNFKSTIMHYVVLTATDRMEASWPDVVWIHTYDTENNIALNIERYNTLANKVINYLPKDPIYNKVWSITSKADVGANEWVTDVLYKFFKDKIEDDKNSIVEYTCFTDRIKNEPLKLPYPSFIEIDSFSEFESDATVDSLKDQDEEKTNTIFMKQGLYKTKVMKDLPRLSNKSNIFFTLTAHLGNKIDMSGPYNKPSKNLQYLKQDEVIKGVSDKINFLTSHLWKVYNSTALINQSTKLPEYPLYEADVSTDLNVVKLQQFRSKTGHSGYVLDIIVSQDEGVLPTLTEFHYLKTNKFGIDGNPRSYNIILRPEVKLSRTTVRKKINEDPLLRRAINITAEIHQLSIYKHSLKLLISDMETLKKDIEKLGYNWDIILQSRGWWSIDNYTTKLPPYLTSVDILKMSKGLYHPFWLDDNKQVKKQWQKHFKEYEEKKDEKTTSSKK